MDFNCQNIKELLKNEVNLIIDDNLKVEELKKIADLAKEKKRHVTIVANITCFEDLKEIALRGNEYVTIDVRKAVRRSPHK